MPIRTNVHSVILGAAIAGTLATLMAQCGIGRERPESAPNLLILAQVSLAYGIIFMSAHLIARRVRLHSAGAYAALGALAGGAATWLGFTLAPGAAETARTFEPAILSAAFCMLTGALYRLHATYAGRDWREALAAE